MTLDAQIVENIILTVVGIWAMWKLDQLLVILKHIAAGGAYRPDPTGREAPGPVADPAKAAPSPTFKKGERNLYVPESIVPKSFNSRFDDSDA